MAAAAKEEEEEVNEYYDIHCLDSLLIPALHSHPLVLSSKPGLAGMVYEIQSEMVGKDLESLLRRYVDTSGKQVIDLVYRYKLVELDDIRTEEIFDVYMTRYIERMNRRWRIFKDEDEDAKVFNREIGGVLNYIRNRFRYCKFYTGCASASDRYSDGYDFPTGLIVIADTEISDPPTFYYLKHGLCGNFNPAVAKYLSRRNLPRRSSEEEEEDNSVGHEEEEEEEEEDNSVGQEEEAEEEDNSVRQVTMEVGDCQIISRGLSR